MPRSQEHRAQLHSLRPCCAVPDVVTMSPSLRFQLAPTALPSLLWPSPLCALLCELVRSPETARSVSAPSIRSLIVLLLVSRSVAPCLSVPHSKQHAIASGSTHDNKPEQAHSTRVAGGATVGTAAAPPPRAESVPSSHRTFFRPLPSAPHRSWRDNRKEQMQT